MSRRPDLELPDLSGRRALVTGASDGIGLRIVTRLAAAGAEVVMPVRNAAKGEAVAARIRQEIPGRPAGHRLAGPCLLGVRRRARRTAAR